MRQGSAPHTRNGLDEGNDSVPECIDCGVCCHSPMTKYVRLFESDEERLGARLSELSVEIDGYRYMRMTEGHCASLSLDATQAICTIYEVRPCVCRDLERGSFDCARQREEKARAPSGLVTIRTAAERTDVKRAEGSGR